MPILFTNLLAWAERNERRLGAALFIFGFISDLLTFGLLQVDVINLIFLAYLILAAAGSFLTHIFSEQPAEAPWWKKTLAVLAPLAAQYALGGLLSGFVVFYAKNSAFSVSWPFIALIFIAYLGSEYFRKYKDYLVFQTALFFFTLYAYAIFALPLAVGDVGPWVFGGSSAIACVLFALFLLGLRITNRERYMESRPAIIMSGLVILAAVNIAYFTDIIPPVPLALAEGGVYHSVIKSPTGYTVTTEGERPWWDIRTQVMHVAQNDSLYVVSAVKAPIAFSSTVVHRWQYDQDGDWVTKSVVAFPINGGRAGGYRGYSEEDTLSAGEWRVRVETTGGQVIGVIRFNVESATTTPALIEKSL